MAEKSKKSGSGKLHWVGVDLGGTKVLASVYGEDFRSLGQCKKKTKAYEGAKAGMERIAETVQEALEDAGVEAGLVSGIGVGCAGLVDPVDGILVETPNLGWKRAPLAKVLSEEFGCPVVLANDVDAGTYGEHRMGAGKGAAALVGIFPGTGIGGGAVLDGQILTGARRSCLEIGHIPVQPDGPLCGCGQRGCLEAVSSRLAIAAAAAIAARRGLAPHLMENTGADLTRIRSRAIADSIENGDEVVERIVRDAARWVGVGVAALVNLLAPDRVVLGGGLVEELPKLYLKEVTDAARGRVMRAYRDEFDVVAASLGDDAVVCGAAAWVEHCVSSAGKGKDGKG